MLLSIWDPGLLALQEQFVVVFLNNRQQVIGWRVLNIGSMETCIIDIRLLALKKDDLVRFSAGMQLFSVIMPPILGEFGGSVVKQSNHHFLISFRGVSQAVHAAFQLQKAFADCRSGIPRDRLLFTIGLSTGVPVTEKNLIFEEAIRLAERMAMCGKEEIVVSAEVRELYDSENPSALARKKGVSCLTRADEQFITRLMDHAEKCWSEIDLKVDDLNKPVGYSKPQLYRKMLLLTGKSPITFIKEYRLNEALGLLNKEAGNVSQIAYEAGFSSPSYFAKCFQKRFGQSPTEYLAARVG